MKFEITKDQILDLYETSGSINESKLKKMFPDAFKVELEVGKWYKNVDAYFGDTLFFLDKIESKTNLTVKCGVGYGFNIQGKWLGSGQKWIADNLVLATTEEVESALIAEAKKRGFKEGVWFRLFKNKYQFVGDEINLIINKSILSNDDNFIFNSGVWAEIIPTMTKKEAEEKLGVKIV